MKDNTVTIRVGILTLNMGSVSHAALAIQRFSREEIKNSRLNYVKTK